MRKWIDLVEGVRRSDGLKQRDVMRAIYRYAKDEVQNGDIAETWADFLDNVRELKSNLQFPLKVYRGLYLELEGEEYERVQDAMDYDWDAHEADRVHCPDDLAKLLVGKMNWKAVGTSWTWDRRCAVLGGALDNDNMTNVILEANVVSRHVDLLVTIFQNLTVYQEEKEVRLFANMPIQITGITPSNHFLKLPIRANTGSESWDQRSSVFRDILPYMK